MNYNPRWARLLLGLVPLAVAATLSAQQQPQQQAPPARRPGLPGGLAGQLPPGVTPDQALQLLQQRPELGAVLRQRLQQSGLTAEDIRARLRAAGYPSSLLDQYLGQDTLPPVPGQSMIEAVSVLGLASFTRQDSLLLSGDSVAYLVYRDSLRIDSIVKEDSIAKTIPGLRLYGLDAFRKATTQFQSLASGPVDPTYRLGPGDALVLILTGDVEAAFPLEVTREGFVIVPDAGQIFVTNLTMAQLHEVLFTRLGRAYSGIARKPTPTTRFDVTVTRVRAIGVRVVGEVMRPGTYQIAATGGPLAALYEAGGLKENGNFRAIEVRRGSQLLGTVDLYGYLLHGMTPADIRLQAGDVVFVPVRGPRVKIAGAVIRPAIYEVKPTETIADLIRIAGGLAPEAAANTVTIDRILPPDERTAPGRSRTVVTVDLKAALDSAAGDPVTLAAGDSVTVFGIRSAARTQSVTIEGSVWQPGTYRLEPGMRLADLIKVAGGLRPETYAERAQILRIRPDSTKYLIGVPLEAAGTTGTAGAPATNLALHELDKVTIYARTEFRPERRIGVWGSVKKPGMVAYADSMTLRDAVLLAGGTTEDAYLAQAEISRLAGDGVGQGDSLAVVLKVPLDSSFVLDPRSPVRRSVGAGDAPLVYLSPYDNVFIRRQPGFEEPRTVTLTGEVRFPGRYTLTSKTERLADVIQRAGGLTPQAYADGIRFFRRELEFRPKTDFRRVSVPLRRTAADSAAGIVRLAAAGDTARYVPPPLLSRVAIDLPRVLRDGRYRDNLVLAAGDSIHIPVFIPTVRVEGAVNAPATVTYVQGAGLQYYVDAAGGYSRFADVKGVFVQQPNGLIQKKGSPEGGAVVVVPARESVPSGGFNWATTLTLLGQLAASATTIIIVLKR